MQFHALRLDDVQGDLICDAVRVAGDRGTALYEFELRAGATRLLRGRATVVLDANERIRL
jgi:predicted hotdog family 3-hydroxylacyl-ACP dehydratase